MSGLTFLLLMSAVSSYSFFSVVVLALACYLMLQINQSTTGFSHYLFLFFSVMLVPGSALLAGIILDRCCNLKNSPPLFAHIAFLGSWALAFQSEMALDFMEAAFSIIPAGDITNGVAWLVLYLGGLFFCGSVIAFCLVVAIWLVEVPLLWCGKSGSHMTDFSLSAFRPILIVVGVALSFNLIAALFVSELWPTVILGRLLG